MNYTGFLKISMKKWYVYKFLIERILWFLDRGLHIIFFLAEFLREIVVPFLSLHRSVLALRVRKRDAVLALSRSVFPSNRAARGTGLYWFSNGFPYCLALTQVLNLLLYASVSPRITKNFFPLYYSGIAV